MIIMAGGAFYLNTHTLPQSNTAPAAGRRPPPWGSRRVLVVFGYCSITPFGGCGALAVPGAPPLADGTFGKLSPRRARLRASLPLWGSACDRLFTPRRLRAWAHFRSAARRRALPPAFTWSAGALYPRGRRVTGSLARYATQRPPPQFFFCFLIILLFFSIYIYLFFSLTISFFLNIY
jgi:hypothetical protein